MRSNEGVDMMWCFLLWNIMEEQCVRSVMKKQIRIKIKTEIRKEGLYD